jgi:hypothetical protein
MSDQPHIKKGTRHCVECLKHSKTARWTDQAGVATVYGFVIVPPPFRAKVVIRTDSGGRPDLAGATKRTSACGITVARQCRISTGFAFQP